MHTSSLRNYSLRRALIIAVLMTATVLPCFGQLNSRPGSIALIARLESLSVTTSPADGFSLIARTHDEFPHVPISLSTSWAVPSNRTTVRVIEDGTPLFAQPSGESNHPGHRTDRLDVAIAHERSETDRENKRRLVVIFVQAL